MSHEKITKEHVEHVAKLSNLPLKGAEFSQFADLFNETLEYVDDIEELDTEDYVGTSQVTGQKNVYQVENENRATLSREDVLSNAPSTLNGLFVADAVFDRK